MKFKCNSSNLQKAINIVEKAITHRTSLPVLENIYMSLNENCLTLRGNDLELGIETTITVDQKTPGSILVKAKTISTIVSKLNNKDLTLEVVDNQVKIQGDNIDFSIHGESSSEYPVFPSVEQGTKLTLSALEIRTLIQHTIFSVSFDETKHFLNGVLIKNDQDNLLFVATDGYRLSLKKHTITPLDKEFYVIAPYKAINELNKILQGGDEERSIEMTVSESQVAFKLEGVLLISRVIQGQFPDYKQVIPKSAEYAFKVNRKRLLEASERASIIASASNNVVKFSFEPDTLSISSSAAGLGAFNESVSILQDKGDKGARIAFNIRLVLDVIKTISTDEVVFSFNNELSPCSVEPIDDTSFTYIIMPIRTSDFQVPTEEKEPAVAEATV